MYIVYHPCSLPSFLSGAQRTVSTAEPIALHIRIGARPPAARLRDARALRGRDRGRGGGEILRWNNMSGA